MFYQQINYYFTPFYLSLPNIKKTPHCKDSKTQDKMSKTIILTLLAFLSATTLFAQKRPTNYRLEASTYISNHDNPPFWMTSNQNGIVPNEDCALAKISIYTDFKPTVRSLQFTYAVDIAGYTTKEENKAIISQLYGSLKWKDIQLDLGVKHRPARFEGLSSTNGDILWSSNSRSYPGYCLKLSDYTHFKIMPRWLSLRMEYGDYILNDNRYMGDMTRLHHKNFFLKADLSDKLSITGGIDHYAMWGGESEQLGRQPSGFSDYLRVITGREGGGDALMTDQINAIGNHLGSYSLNIEHKGKTNWTFFYSHPFEDGSGREFQNYPDGNYGIYINRRKEKALINHIVYEFTYTRHQSGNFVKEPGDHGDLHRGNDSYFNNGVYRSGYTYFNHTMGSPFFITNETDENGITTGIKINKFLAHHIGLKGDILRNLSYRLIFSHVRNYGKTLQKDIVKERNYHTMFELELKQSTLPFNITAGASYSRLSETPDNTGFYIKIFRNGIF